jgi:uncharacterized membrane protein
MSKIWARQMARVRVATGAVLIGALTAITIAGCSVGKYEQVKVEGGAVNIPVGKLSDGKAKFYKMTHNGKEIVFFAVKTADGNYRTAFDACDSCYKDKKGYEQQGDVMNCTNCNQKFAIDRLGPNATGGCNPGYLPNTVTSNSVTISASDLAAGAKYF